MTENFSSKQKQHVFINLLPPLLTVQHAMLQEALLFLFPLRLGI